jgi:hypothetical protein
MLPFRRRTEMDHRDVAAATHKWWKDGSINEKRMTLTVEIDDGDTAEEFVIPFRWEVCRTCDGKGKYVNPNIDRQGISPEEFAEDPEFFEDYRSGMYDIPCALCEGRRVVPVPDENGVAEEVLAKVREHINWLAQEAREIVHEREMGY